MAVPIDRDQTCDDAIINDDHTMTIAWQTQNPVQLKDLLPNTVYEITVTSGLSDSLNPSVINAGQSTTSLSTTRTARRFSFVD